LSSPFEPQGKLTFDQLIEVFSLLSQQFPDKRTGQNTIYTLKDVALAAFSIFFTQSPSFLAHQTLMAKNKGKSNAQTLFGLQAIPSDNHIRDLLDHVPPQSVYPMFEHIFSALNEQGHLQDFRAVNDQLLIALDGTQYHSSDTVNCDQCTVKNHRNGTTNYSHTVITPVIVSPGHRQVIALEPEFITPQDGHQKQDCETAAAKRWIDQYASRYRDMNVTLLGDDLYSRQPYCECVLAAGLNFLFVCKPQSHKTLHEYLEGMADASAVQTMVKRRRKGQRVETDTYRFANQLPLRDADDALDVNWCELTTTVAGGKVTYHNAFVTNHPVSESNVAEMIQSGRARWKVENENNNTLKTRGYHLSHNFGHGKQHLSTTLATINLLAFLMHTVLDRMDSKYQHLRASLPTRKTFFEHVRALTCYLCFEDFDALLDFMLNNLEVDIQDSR